MFGFLFRRRKTSPGREVYRAGDESSSLQKSLQTDGWSPSLTTTPATNVPPSARKPSPWFLRSLHIKGRKKKTKTSPGREVYHAGDESSSLQKSLQTDGWSPSLTTTPATNVPPSARKPSPWFLRSIHIKGRKKETKTSPGREVYRAGDESSSLHKSLQTDGWSPSLTTTPATDVPPSARKPSPWFLRSLHIKGRKKETKTSPGREVYHAGDESSSLQKSVCVMNDTSSPESGKTQTNKRGKTEFGLTPSKQFRVERVFPHEDKEGTHKEASTSDHVLRPLAGSNSPGLNDFAKPSSKSNEANADQELACFGFPNLGRTCCMNSILQSLVNLSCFVNEIRKEMLFWSSSRWSLVFRFILVAQACRYSNVRQLKVEVLTWFKWIVEIYNVDFDPDKQKDAHEFLIRFLSTMRSVSPKIKRIEGNLTYVCPVVEHISVQVLNSRTCRGCGEQSCTVEDLLSLSLGLVPGGSVAQCLQEYFKENQIEYSCHCGAQQSSLQSSFSTLPNVLILQLSRLIFTSSGRVWKIKIPITLSQELVVTKELMADKNTTAHYSLVSVVSYMGSNADSGHYICDSVHRSSDMGNFHNSWLTYDDEDVSQTTAEDVCRRRVTDAYLLFYEKQAIEELTHLHY